MRNAVRKPAKSLMSTKYMTPIVAAPIAMKFQNVTIAPPTLSASNPPSGRDSEPTSGPMNAIAIVTAGNWVLISSGNAAETDEGPERPDVDEGHDPGMLAADDGELVLEGGLGRG